MEVHQGRRILAYSPIPVDDYLHVDIDDCGCPAIFRTAVLETTFRLPIRGVYNPPFLGVSPFSFLRSNLTPANTGL